MAVKIEIVHWRRNSWVNCSGRLGEEVECSVDVNQVEVEFVMEDIVRSYFRTQLFLLTQLLLSFTD
jgi:hypothetical protein